MPARLRGGKGHGGGTIETLFPGRCLLAVVACLLASSSARLPAVERAESCRAPVLGEFRSWVARCLLSPAGCRTRLVENGLALARRRRPVMRRLVAEEPGRALRESLSLDQWWGLPPEVRAEVEEPFSVLAGVEVRRACRVDDCGRIVAGRDGCVPDGAIEITFPDGSRVEVRARRRQGTLTSRHGMPLQGIRLDGLAALRPEVFQVLTHAEATVSPCLFPPGNPDPCRDPLTRESLGSDPVAVLSGGRVFVFRHRRSVDELERRAAALEREAGDLGGGSRLLIERLAHSPPRPRDLVEPNVLAFDPEILEGDIYQELSGGGAAVSTMGEHRVRVLLVDFSDKPGAPISPSTLEGRINGAVNRQFAEMSFNKTSITATVDREIYRMPRPTTYYNGKDDGDRKNGALHDHARQAAGVAMANYEHLIVAFKNIGMGYGGMAAVGGKKLWLNGALGSRIIVHELGHNYGLGHASYWKVNGTDPVDPGGESTTYGDNTDIMGSGGMPGGHFSIKFKRKLNWLGAGAIWDARSTSRVYRIYRFDHPATDPANARRGIRIPRGPDEWYWVSHRWLIGRQNYRKGAQVLWERPGQSRAWLVDMTPRSAGGKDDAGLALGRTYSDAAAGVHITPVLRGGTEPDQYLDVVVNRGAFPSNRAPVVTLDAHPYYRVGARCVVGVTATDPDGDELACSWDFGDGLVKGNSGTLTAVSHTWKETGRFRVRVVVSDMKGKTVTRSRTVTVGDLPGFIRGDANADGIVEISDAIRILLFLFSGEEISCKDAADVDDSGRLDLTDALHLLRHLFHRGPAPPAPATGCGPDRSTGDRLDCASDAACR